MLLLSQKATLTENHWEAYIDGKHATSKNNKRMHNLPKHINKNILTSLNKFRTKICPISFEHQCNCYLCRYKLMYCIKSTILFLFIFSVFFLFFLGEIRYTATLVNPRWNKGDVMWCDGIQAKFIKFSLPTHICIVTQWSLLARFSSASD